MPDALISLLEKFGEDVVTALAEAIMSRDAAKAAQHARIMAETDADVAALHALANKVTGRAPVTS
jgi:predicted ArsR family transcriptional regulator